MSAPQTVITRKRVADIDQLIVRIEIREKAEQARGMTTIIRSTKGDELAVDRIKRVSERDRKLQKTNKQG